MVTSDERTAEAYALSAGEGEAVWFLATHMTIKSTTASTGGTIGVVDALVAPGFAPPLHLHHREDEPMWILEGEVTFSVNGRSWTLGPGGFIFLPRHVPHTFRVEGNRPARILTLHLPAGFEQYYIELGTPARNAGLPPPAKPDVPRLVAVAAKYGLEYIAEPVA
jgi:mannose-6-phosphate isomerase-like protein (cupin superfamily)